MNALDYDTLESLDFADAEGTRESDASAVRKPTPSSQRREGVVIGTLVGFRDNGGTPLVTFAAQPGAAAIAARATLDMNGTHIGRDVLLMFENGSAERPIVIGLLRGAFACPIEQRPGHVEVEADGDRLLLSAHSQLVLKCGSASITLTKDGKVLIQGSYVSNRSTGVMRIKGGSVQLN
jgi:hypothetical protein